MPIPAARTFNLERAAVPQALTAAAPVAVELIVGQAQVLSQWRGAEFAYGAEGAGWSQQ